MFKVLFKFQCESDIEHVKGIMLSIHKSRNDDEFIFSTQDCEADIKIDVPKVQKKRALILDHSGTVHRLGFPCSIEYDELISDSDGLNEAKRQQKEKEKKEKQPKECSRCNYMKPAGQYICAKCGYKPLAGENVESDESRDLEIVKGEKKAYTMEEKQQFYSELIAIKREFAMKGKAKSEKWQDGLYKQKFLVWPKGLKYTAKTPSQETRNYVKSRMIAFAKGRK